ncbi:hypothetical protein BM527_16515 [Alteromonas sp. Mex14]|nr:hypothetical protein BM527_16515 [Alteromonas sp. Mex14]
MNLMKSIPENFFYILLFVCVSLITGNYLLSYDLHMDDAWVMAGNYVHQSIFSSEGIDTFIQNITNGYEEQWRSQGRFPGVLPIIRGIEGILITKVEIHYFLNLLFHGVNSFFLYKILKNILKVDRKIALISGLFFSCCFAVSTSLYALTLFIGSGYVNYLTLFLAMILITPNYDSYKRMFWALYIVYFLIGLGNYSFIVVVPSIALFTYISTKNIKYALSHFLLLMAPLVLNLIVISFAPETKYIGTTPKLEIAHILQNLTSLINILVSDKLIINLTVLFFISSTIVYGVKSRKVAFVNIMPIFVLFFGYITLYSISARDTFPNPYFLYIPYSGLILLLAVCMNVCSRYYFLYGTFLFLVLIANFSESQDYRNFRQQSGRDISKFQTLFQDIEKVTIGGNSKVYIILFENFNFHYLSIGYFDRTINSWRRRNNNSIYVMATDYLKIGEEIKFKVGFNQYNANNQELLTVSEIISRLKEVRTDKELDSSAFDIIKVQSDGEFKAVDLEEVDTSSIIYNSLYSKELYGNGNGYYWSDGSFSFDVYNSDKDLGKQGVLTFTVTSLFDDVLTLTSNDFERKIKVTKSTTVNTCLKFPINQLLRTIRVQSDKSVRPKGDSRELSFRIDTNATFSIVDESNVIEIDRKFTHFKSTGFYDDEKTHRWTGPNAKIYFDKCLNLTGNLIIELRGSFESENLPQAMINDTVRPTRIIRKSKGALRYEFDSVESPLESLSFKVNGFKPGNEDPRELGFMFHSLRIEKLKGAIY